jgi:radical SAM protein with 4Fe4S-binding SPASM domain
MSLEEATTLCRVAKNMGTTEIDILGGEPLLITWMKDFILYALGAGFSINISTNGSFPNIVRELAALETHDLHIGFSILGFEKTHNRMTRSDNFLKALEGIRAVLASGKEPIVKSALTKDNFHEIHELVLYLSELGIKKYYLLHEDLIGRKEQLLFFSFPQFWEFYANLKNLTDGVVDIDFVAASGFCMPKTKLRARCNAGLTKIAVMPDGSAFPCNLFSGFSDFYLGNILKDTMEDIWGNKVLQFFRDVNHKNMCKKNECDHFLACSGGCPAHSYFFHSTLDSVDPRCDTI